VTDPAAARAEVLALIRQRNNAWRAKRAAQRAQEPTDPIPPAQGTGAVSDAHSGPDGPSETSAPISAAYEARNFGDPRHVEHWHVGRSWVDTRLEDVCPCPKEPCGLVVLARADPDCPEHPPARFKSMRQGHPADRCPAEETS
jgi:hypothetical protein